MASFIQRGVNINDLDNVLKMIRTLPKESMPKQEYEKYLRSNHPKNDEFFEGETFIKTYSQMARELGLYYIDNNNYYHPRFNHNISKKAVYEYMLNWCKKFTVPHPYMQGFDNIQKPIFLEPTIIEELRRNPSETNIQNILKKILHENDDLKSIDIFCNYINEYSELLETQNNTTIKINEEKKMEADFDRNDRDAYFKNLNMNNQTDIPYPHNWIIFGAPGTGKSFMLKEKSQLFEHQEPLTSDELDIIKQEILEANESNDKLNRYIAIGFTHSDFLKDYTNKQLRETFGIENCEDNIYVGAKSKAIYDTYIDDAEDEDTITKRITEAKKAQGEGMRQILAAIGFRFSESLIDYKKDELKTDYPLDTRAQIYWIYRAAHGAKYIKNQKQEKIKYLERVTFHPNYSYSQFVGTYKPIQDPTDDKQIKYEYVPGPFMRMYSCAVKNPKKNFLLLIEEINRANVAAVFGDVFQLLDRYGENGDDEGNHAYESEYPVQASEDIKKYLYSKGINEDEIRIPNNMFIWATMNSADQGVFPMDTAFKRRWEFEYIDINKNEKEASKYDIPINSNETVNWNDLRVAINDKLIELKVNEDKLMGPFFLSKSLLETANSNEKFIELFESKVLMYLFEDAAKMKVQSLFNLENKKYIYSEICKEFENKGLAVFNFCENTKVNTKEKIIKNETVVQQELI